MDIITGLLRTSRKHDSIMVNRMSKVAHFITVKSTSLASEVAQIFIREIVRLHGFAKKIVSDRYAKFTSKFWKVLTVLEIRQPRGSPRCEFPIRPHTIWCRNPI